MDADDLTNDELIDEVATWAARTAQGEARLLTLIGRLDARQAWAGHGVVSCAHWLSFRLGWARNTARERVRVARALTELPLVQEAFEAGRVTYCQVRAITRVATPEGQENWLALARHTSGGELEKVVRGAARALAADRGPVDRPVPPAVRTHWDDDGDLVLTVRIPAHQAVPLLAALEQHRATEQTQREQALATLLADAGVSAEASSADPRSLVLVGAEGASAEAPIDLSAVPAADWCDPLEPYPTYDPPCPNPLAELDRELSPEEQQTLRDWERERDTERAIRQAWNTRRAELLTEAAARGIGTGRATLADALVRAVLRPTECAPVTVQLLHDPLSGWARTADDELLPPATLDRLLGAVPWKRTRRAADRDLTRYDQGRSSRTVSPALRTLLSQLDGERCRFPGCSHTRFLHAHHIRFWRNGGATDLSNLLLLCTSHHRFLHRAGYQLALDADRTLTVTAPDGTRVPHRHDLPHASAEALPTADPRALDRRLHGDPFDLSYVVSVMLQHAA